MTDQDVYRTVKQPRTDAEVAERLRKRVDRRRKPDREAPASNSTYGSMLERASWGSPR